MEGVAWPAATSIIAGIGVAAVVMWAAASPAPAVATEITPNTTADEYNATAATCSLREAIESANTNGAFSGCPAGELAGDVIRLDSGATYELSRTPPAFGNTAGDLYVDGGGPLSIVGATIDANSIDRPISVGVAGELTLVRVTITGGLLASGTGGGVASDGALIMRDSTVVDNVSLQDAGGVGSFGPMTLINVTVVGNRADNFGGGIVVSVGATTELRNVTVTDNDADFDQNGIGQSGGIHRFNGTVSIKDSILSGNRTYSAPNVVANDCGGTITSLGNNLIGTTDGCGLTPLASDIVGKDPKLSSLLANRPPATSTMVPLAGSPAIDRGSSDCPPLDQRGFGRVGACDIGAAEHVACAGKLATDAGTSGADVLNGSSADDVIVAGAGGDRVSAGGGRDLVCAGQGPDRVGAGAGADRVLGEAGNDRLRGGPGRDRLVGGRGRDRLLGGPGLDILLGGPQRDLLIGGPRPDRCVGGPGRDRIRRC